MPTLLLSARQTDDAQKLWRARIAEKWDVVRVHGWRVPKISCNSLFSVICCSSQLFAIHVFATFFQLCVLSRLNSDET
jgi:hypothetical protein